MERGRVVEQGTHETLLALHGVYRAMWDMQTGFIVDPAGRQARVTAQRLRLIPLFASLDEARLATLAGQFVTERYDQGQTIVEQGEPGDRFYLLVRGSADVLLTRQGKEQRIDARQDGDYFGEMALLANTPRTATVRATTPCLLLTLGRHDFQALVGSAPEIGAEINQAFKVRQQRIDGHDGQS
jgi:ATP-binding cassette subfamily B protein